MSGKGIEKILTCRNHHRSIERLLRRYPNFDSIKCPHCAEFISVKVKKITLRQSNIFGGFIEGCGVLIIY